jgi:cell division protein FtsN
LKEGCCLIAAQSQVQFHIEMSRTVEGETEILLGNKHLLGIFFLLAVLVGVAFVGGYMLGHGSFDKRSTTDSLAQNAAPPSTGGVQTKAVNPAPDAAGSPSAVAPPEPASAPQKAAAKQPSGAREARPQPDKSAEKTADAQFAPLPSDTAAAPARQTDPAQPTTVRRSNELYTPEPGQRFLQVAAEGRDSAENVASVLSQAGLPAHVVAKPGDDKLFRVLVGPIKDNNDLTAKREALTKKGFTKVIPRTF